MSEDTTPQKSEIPIVPEPEESKTAPAKKSHALLSPTAVDVIGGVSSVLVGVTTAWHLIEERAYKNLSSLHWFEEMKEERRKVGQNIAKKLVSKELTPDGAHEELKKAILTFGERANDELEKAASGTIFKKFNLLRPHQKQEVIVTAIAFGGAALSVILGPVFLMTRGKFSEKEEDRLADKNSAADNRGVER